MTRVKTLQVQSDQLRDIPWNFLIGDDGLVYEGRGFRFQGEILSENSHISSFDDVGILIAFIGNFSIRTLSSQQVNALDTFLEYAFRRDVLIDSFKLLLQDQLVETSVPADGLLDFLHSRQEFRECKKRYQEILIIS